MEFGSMLRLFGISSFIGGIMIILVQPWFYFDPQSFMAAYFDHIGYAFLAFGIIGLYLTQYKSIGGFGLFSFTILFFSFLFWIGFKWFQTFVVADLVKSAPELMEAGLKSAQYGMNAALYSLLISIFLFAIISLWKGALSRWGFSILLIASIIGFLGPAADNLSYGSLHSLLTQIIAGIAFIWLGASLMRKKHEVTYQNSIEDRQSGDTMVSHLDESKKHESDNQIQTEMGTS